MHGYLLRRTQDRELAADLTQETFIKATRSLLGWSGGTAEGWLLAVARSVLADHMRRRHLETLPLPDDSVVGAMQSDADLTPDAVAVRDVLDRLPARQARLLRLADLEGFRAVEIAAMFGAKEGAVRMALLRARAAFRDAWTDDERRGEDQ